MSKIELKARSTLCIRNTGEIPGESLKAGLPVVFSVEKEVGRAEEIRNNSFLSCFFSTCITYN